MAMDNRKTFGFSQANLKLFLFVSLLHLFVLFFLESTPPIWKAPKKGVLVQNVTLSPIVAESLPQAKESSLFSTAEKRPIKSASSTKNSKKRVPIPAKEKGSDSKKKELLLDKPKPVSPALPSCEKKLHEPSKQKTPKISLEGSQKIAQARKDLESIRFSKPNRKEGIQGGQEEAEELAAFLHKRLQLPEFGRVEVEFQLTPEGKIINLRTRSSESERNRKYLEENLPKLILPVAKKIGSDHLEEDFVLVLHNE